ncbi:hypothetical protein [Belnapia sp. F-4-1]|uniref:hypothetical protein n=1 Tax=Belnapia sp. F-4-1 TaxID=1545443 RepID=UPI0011847134|nr:hypothetical protein [Belnapia sp. F-4-1]
MQRASDLQRAYLNRSSRGSTAIKGLLDAVGKNIRARVRSARLAGKASWAPSPERDAGLRRGEGWFSTAVVKTHISDTQSEDLKMYHTNVIPAAEDATDVRAAVCPPVPQEIIAFPPWPLSAERMSGWLSS